MRTSGVLVAQPLCVLTTVSSVERGLENIAGRLIPEDKKDYGKKHREAVWINCSPILPFKLWWRRFWRR